MTTRKSGIWKNLTIILLGGAGLSTWLIGACDSDDRAEEISPPHTALQAPGALDAVNQMPEGYALTPGGVVIHKDCIHQIPDGAVATSDLRGTLKGKNIAQYATCTHKPYRLASATATTTSVSGDSTTVASALEHPRDFTFPWVEFSGAVTASTMFNHMDVGYWVVPPNPAAWYGATIFLKVAMEPTPSQVGILQTVLQWGQSAAGGGGFWTYANWAVTGTWSNNWTIFVSPLKTANPGDQMWSSLDMYNQDSSYQYWYLTIKDVTKNDTTTSSVAWGDSRPFTQAQAGALEVYSLQSCSELPSGSSGTTYFPQPNLYEGSAYYDRHLSHPTWLPFTYHDTGWANGPICGFNISVGYWQHVALLLN